MSWQTFDFTDRGASKIITTGGNPDVILWSYQWARTRSKDLAKKCQFWEATSLHKEYRQKKIAAWNAHRRPSLHTCDETRKSLESNPWKSMATVSYRKLSQISIPLNTQVPRLRNQFQFWSQVNLHVFSALYCYTEDDDVFEVRSIAPRSGTVPALCSRWKPLCKSISMFENVPLCPPRANDCVLVTVFSLWTASTRDLDPAVSLQAVAINTFRH